MDMLAFVFGSGEEAGWQCGESSAFTCCHTQGGRRQRCLTLPDKEYLCILILDTLKQFAWGRVDATSARLVTRLINATRMAPGTKVSRLELSYTCCSWQGTTAQAVVEMQVEAPCVQTCFVAIYVPSMFHLCSFPMHLTCTQALLLLHACATCHGIAYCTHPSLSYMPWCHDRSLRRDSQH